METVQEKRRSWYLGYEKNFPKNKSKSAALMNFNLRPDAASSVQTWEKGEHPYPVCLPPKQISF